MTAYEIVLKVLVKLGEDTADSTVIAEYKDEILDAINLADGEVCGRALHPALREQVSLDGNKEFDMGDMTHGVVKIKSVTRVRPYSADSSYGDADRLQWHDVGSGHIVVPDADANGVAWVHYEAAPTPMTADDDTDTSAPEFTPEHFHDVYVFKALAEVFAGAGRGDTASSVFYENKYEDRLSQIQPMERQTAITNTNSY